MEKMIKIDGSFGEGGGQIIRSSLSLAMLTGKAFEIEKIRAGRRKPGLMRQHLTCVRAAAEICDAQAEGAEIGSQDLIFRPRKIRSGKYRFEVGTAGSTGLVLQTVLPALLAADKESEVILTGGTHNPMAPPFDFLDEVFAPAISKMGALVELELVNYGFYPAGGGEIRVKVKPWLVKFPLDLVDRDEFIQQSAIALASKMPMKIAQNEAGLASNQLGWGKSQAIVQEVESAGPGNALMVKMKTEEISAIFTSFGIKRKPWKEVVREAVEMAKDYIDSGVPVDEHLADQLLLYMAIVGKGCFRTNKLTMHCKTNMAVIEKFMDVKFVVEEEESGGFNIKLQT